MPVLAEVVGAAPVFQPPVPPQTRTVPPGQPEATTVPPGLPGAAAVPPGPAVTFGSAATAGRAGGTGLTRGGRIALVVVGALLVVVGAVTGIVRLTAPTPQSVVEDYFDALADGDTATAMALVAGGDEVDPSRYPLLGAAALADKRLRPSDVRVGEPGEPTSVHGDQGYLVEVTYRAGGREARQTMLVVRTDDEFRLRVPFVAITVNGQLGRRVSINGVDLGEAVEGAVAFPGAFEGRAEGNALLAAASVTATASEAGNGSAVLLDFGEPALADGAATRIQSEVRAELDRCAASTEERPSGCPFAAGVYGTDVSVRWSIEAYPTVSVELARGLFGGVTARLSDDGTGLARWTATYTDYLGTARTESGEDNFGVSGTVEASGSDIRISLT
jgi:hypothetical protein